jgi:hypothetical protein
MILKIRRTLQKIFEKYYWEQSIGKLTIETRRICWFLVAAASGIVEADYIIYLEYLVFGSEWRIEECWEIPIMAEVGLM